MDEAVVSALWGTEGIGGVQWVLNAPEAQQWVVGVIASLLIDPRSLVSCRLHRAKFKPGRKLTAYYTVTVQREAGVPLVTREATVVWRPEAETASNAVTDEMRAMEREADAHGLLAPFAHLAGVSVEAGLQVQVAPLDVEFPRLVRVTDPQHARSLAQSVYRSAGHASEAASSYEVSAIRYRPGQRHVLRYEPADAAPGGQDARTLFVKLYEDADECARAFGVASRVADWLSIYGNGLQALRPLGYNVEDAVILYPRLVGTPLSDKLGDAINDVAPYLEKAGLVLRTLHRRPDEIAAELAQTSAQPSALINDLKPHSFSKEIKAVARTCEHIFAFLPQVGAQIDTLLKQAQSLYDQIPQEEPTFAHGDYKADHLWVTSNGLTLMDFDTCYLADPAIDVGKFLSDLHWWSIWYGNGDVEQAKSAFLESYAPGVPSARLRRAQIYEVLVLIKSTAHRVRLFDDNWSVRTEELIARATQIMSQIA